MKQSLMSAGIVSVWGVAACSAVASPGQPEALTPKANADYARICAERIRAEQSANDDAENQWPSYIGVLERCAGYLETSIETSDAYAAYVKGAEDPSQCSPVDAYFAVTGTVDAPELAREAERVIRAFVRSGLAKEVNWLGDPDAEVVFVPPISPDGSLKDWRSACSRSLRTFARVAFARVVIAARDKDVEEFRTAIRQTTILSRIASFDGNISSRAAADGARIGLVEHLIKLELPPGFAAAAVSELGAIPMARFELTYECELLRSWGVIDEYHRDAIDKLKQGPLWFISLFARAGFASRADECAILDAASGRIFATFDTDPDRRARAARRSLLAYRMMDSSWIGRRYPIARLLSVSASGIEQRARQYRMRLDGGIAALAVVAFRDAQGRLPETLAELAPRFIDAVPTDWYGEERGITPLRYIRIDAAADPLGRSFKIYSVAGDFEDNGGVEPRGVATESMYIPGKGTDFVVSRRHENRP